MKSILLVKTFLGLVEMMSGLVNASFSLPEWQALKMIFFAPWVGRSVHDHEDIIKRNGSVLSHFLCSKELIISRFNSTNWLQLYFKKHVNGLSFD